MSELALFSLTSRGPVSLGVPLAAGTVHEAVDSLPIGVYTTVRTFAGQRFLGLEAHLDRTEASARAIGIDEPLDRERVRQSLHEIASTATAPGATTRDWTLRIDVLEQPIGRSDSSGNEPSRLTIARAPLDVIDEATRGRGVRMETDPALTRHEPAVKRASFVRERSNSTPAKLPCHERLLVDGEGRILEGASSTFYTLREGTLQTPDSGVLEGVTCGIVLALAEREGFTVERSRLPLDNIADVDGAFLTSSTRGVLAVVEVDDVTIGSGRPHGDVLRLAEAYDRFALENARSAWPFSGTAG